eukprot:jgi/Undpi1/5478/HiC_scaffold_2.g00757.m1
MFVSRFIVVVVVVASPVAVGIQQPRTRLCQRFYFADLGAARGFWLADLGTTVGFRDDTSYLAAHYGGRTTPRSIAQTRSAQEVGSTLHYPRRHANQQASNSNNIGLFNTLAATHQPNDPGATSTTSTPPGRGFNGRKRHSGGSGGGGGDGVAGNNAAGVEGGEGIGGASMIRPTLSQQLASIGKTAENITAGIRETYGLKPLEGTLLTTPSRSFLTDALDGRPRRTSSVDGLDRLPRRTSLTDVLDGRS